MERKQVRDFVDDFMVAMGAGKKIWVSDDNSYGIMYDSEDCEAECNGDEKCEAACYDEEHEVDYEDRFWFR